MLRDRERYMVLGFCLAFFDSCNFEMVDDKYSLGCGDVLEQELNKVQ
jgi:hypothetical protein